MEPTRRQLAVMGMLASALGLAACRSAPIVEETRADFIGDGTLAQRADQIRVAGISLGWVTELRGPGLLRATLNLRSHEAVVDIPFDQQRFAIRYVKSTNLNYDGQTIHRNYNSWVQNLRNAIVMQSASLR